MTATDTQPPITNLADSDEFHQALGDQGRTYINAAYPSTTAFQLRLATGYSPATLRAVATAVRSVGDDDQPNGPESVADALERLADTTEQRPPGDWDRINVTERDRAVVDAWEMRLTARSPLLEPLAAELRTIRDAGDALVMHARSAFRLLPDAELLLPGVDEALWSVLARYAGEEG